MNNPSQVTNPSPVPLPLSLLHLKLPLDSGKRRVGIPVPHANDILCGRGKTINAHLGNRQFHSVISNIKVEYIAATKENKKNYGKLVVQAIRSLNPPGRFLKKDKEDGLWYDIGEKKSLLKTRQALREKAPVLRKLLEDLKCQSGSECQHADQKQQQQDEQHQQQEQQPLQQQQQEHGDNNGLHQHYQLHHQYGQDFHEEDYCDHAFTQAYQELLQGPLLDTEHDACMHYEYQPCEEYLDNHDLEKIRETVKKLGQRSDSSRFSFSALGSQRQKRNSTSAPVA